MSAGPLRTDALRRRAVGLGADALRFGRTLLDLCVPPACPLCGRDGELEPGRLTPRCECRAIFADPACGWCRGCGAPTGPHVPDAADCHHCRREDPFPFAGAVSLGLHEGDLRDAVLKAKADGGRPAARALTEGLLDRRGDAVREAGCDLVVAVPHHWSARLRHGHDAAAEVAATLAAGLNLPLKRPVKKARRTAKQAGQTPTDRRANLRGAFAVPRPGVVAGKTVLLCDDVLTTGTTARRVASVLKTVGAGGVFVAVLARGVGGR